MYIQEWNMCRFLIKYYILLLTGDITLADVLMLTNKPQRQLYDAISN